MKPHMGCLVSDVVDQTLERHRAQRDDREFELQTPSDNPPLIQVLLPQLSEMRHIARLLKQDLLIAVDRDNPERSLADLKTLQAVATHASEPPLLIGQLVSIAIDNLRYHETLIILHDHPDLFSDDQFQTLRALIAKTDHLSDMHKAIDTERMMFLDMIQRAYTINDAGDGYLTPAGHHLLTSEYLLASGEPGPANLAGAIAARVAGVTRNSETEGYSAMIDLWHEQLDHPRPWSLEARKPGVEAMAQARRPQFSSLHPIAAAVMPALESTIEAAWHARHNRDVVDLTLALHQYQRANKAFPDSLDALVPDYLPSLPTDLFDGQPLRYKLQDAKPTIYSIGANRTDEAGAPSNESDYKHYRWLNPLRTKANARPDQLPPEGDWILYPPQP